MATESIGKDKVFQNTVWAKNSILVKSVVVVESCPCTLNLCVHVCVYMCVCGNERVSVLTFGGELHALHNHSSTVSGMGNAWIMTQLQQLVHV